MKNAVEDIIKDVDIKKIKDVIIQEAIALQSFHLVLKEPEKILHRHERHQITSSYGWFTRCCWLLKVAILKKLAQNISHAHILITVINTVYIATTKDWIYSAYQNIQRYQKDLIIADEWENTRACEIDVLQDVVFEFVNWYKTLEDHDQYSIIIDMIRLTDSCVFGKIFTEFIKILQVKIHEEKLEASALEPVPLQPDPKPKKEKKKKGKSKKDKRRKSEIEREKQLLLEQQQREKKEKEELEAINVFLNEKLPKFDNDPLNIELQRLLSQWNTIMTSYKKKLGIGVAPKKPKKKPKKKKKEKVNKKIPDQIQLLPIWINKPIVARQNNAKSLAQSKKVNKYWSFLVKGIKADSKCRQEMDKIGQKLKKNIGRMEPADKLPSEVHLHPKFTNVSYITHNSIRDGYQFANLTCKTLVSDLYNKSSATNVQLGVFLTSFPRRTESLTLNLPL